MASLDTYGLVKELIAAGFQEAQAEAVTKVMVKGRDFDISNLATKADLASEIAGLETKIESSKNELLKWFIGLFVVQLGASFTMIKLLGGH